MTGRHINMMIAGAISAVMMSFAVPTQSSAQVLELPETLYNYSDLDLPRHFNGMPTNTPANNRVTDAGATLGRVLFYDVNLSANNTVACASCHDQAKGFVDGEVFSEGFEGGLTGRNSMATANLAYDNSGFFWDERAATLEEQVLMPIQDAVEMGMTLEGLEEKLAGVSYYSGLFEDAFASPEITSDRISRALAQFMRSMVSYQSRYDEGFAAATNPQSPFVNFSDAENLGKAVFQQNCGRCHAGPVIASPGSRTNGLGDYGDDHGTFAVTGDQRDFNAFKSVSLRNIELTGPYMHDGRFETLEEVVEHYSSGVRGMGPGGGGVPGIPPGGFNFSDEQKAGLIAFMLTLTDNVFVTDPKFSDPFRGEVTSSVDSGLMSAHTASLAVPYPNPASSQSTFAFSVKEIANVRLELRDIRGSLIAELFAANAFSGSQSVTWSGRTPAGHQLPAGSYLLILQVGDEQFQRQVVWMP